MGTVRYTILDGQIVAEKRGASRKFYESDALGSTVALYDNTQTKTDSFTYWPYGETRTSTGSTETKFKYVGTLGCRTQFDGGIYMRARVQQPGIGRWMTVDPLWPMEPAYVYAENAPVALFDASGFSPKTTCDSLYEDCVNCAIMIRDNLNKAIGLGRIGLSGAAGLIGAPFPGGPLLGTLIVNLKCNSLQDDVNKAYDRMRNECDAFKNACMEDASTMCAWLAAKRCTHLPPFEDEKCWQRVYNSCLKLHGKKVKSSPNAVPVPFWLYKRCPKLGKVRIR